MRRFKGLWVSPTTGRRRDTVDPLDQASLTQSNLSKDHQEAVWAFAQKSRPNFTGR
jgi:hypothetical protein